MGERLWGWYPREWVVREFRHAEKWVDGVRPMSVAKASLEDVYRWFWRPQKSQFESGREALWVAPGKGASVGERLFGVAPTKANAWERGLSGGTRERKAPAGERHT